MANAIAAPIQFSHQIHTSLTHDNFLLWKSQILPVIRGHGLEAFLDSSIVPPEQFLTSTEGAQTVNPLYLKWHQQDQLILAWIFSSISPPILAQVIRCETAASVWSHLNQIHSTQSTAKILDLKLQLQTIKKGGSTCSQFIQQIQQIADQLRSIGIDVPDQELVLYTLQGLGSDHESFVTAISMRSPSPSMLELSSLLLTHEARLLTNLKTTSTTMVHLASAGGSDTSHSVNYVSNSNHQFSGNQSNYSSGSNNRGRGYRGRNTSRGRGRSRHSNLSRDQLQCQICTKWGHSAIDCYHRFNIKYTGPPQPPQAPSSSPAPQALLAQPELTSTTSTVPQNPVPWYIDSGASTHVTADINNMSTSHPYSGSEAVHIENGTGLKIEHIGTSLISTSDKSLILTNVLHVPAITKNLLSVS